MIINHRSQRRYVYGGSGIFDVLAKIASRVTSKTPEVLARAQANKLISGVIKKSISAGQKALIDNSDRLTTGLVTKAIDKLVKPSKDVVAKQQASALINSLTQPQVNLSKTPVNLNALISGMGLKPIKSGRGIVLD